jgi:hypothetical protein
MSLFKRYVLISVCTFSLMACTAGRLEYLTPQNERKTACESQYTWQPSVDKYAIEYILGYCAKQATEQGNTVIKQELLALDLSVAEPPKGQVWSQELAKRQYEQGLLTDKEYGYLIAFLDLGHDKKENGK